MMRTLRTASATILALAATASLVASGGLVACDSSDDAAAAPTAGVGGANAGGGTTSTGTGGTGGPTTTSNSGGSGAQGGSVACTTALADRISTTAVATTGSGWGAVFLSAEPNGRAKAGWVAGSEVHVTPLDAADARTGDDLVTEGSEIRGLVAHEDGAAVLVVRGDQMVLVRLDSAGASTFENIIVGDNNHNSEGDRWIDGWPHEGRLAWSGDTYAAYFGQTGNWGSQGNHQGDHLSLFDAAGAAAGGGWDWGCSHSLDVRIAHNANRFGPICLSDCYPGKGIYFNHTESLVSDEPSGNCLGSSNAGLGGLVPVADGFWFSYRSAEGRLSQDVGLVHIGNDGAVSAPLWLTSTDAVEEQNAHLVAYGAGMLAGWSSGTEASLVQLDAAGAIVEGPAPIAASLPSGSDMVSFPSGDAAWAVAGDSGFTVVRVAHCE